MTATIEKTKAQLLKEFNAWYDERDHEEKQSGKPFPREEMWAKAEELDIVDEFINEVVHEVRQEMWLERQLAGEKAGQ